MATTCTPLHVHLCGDPNLGRETGPCQIRETLAPADTAAWEVTPNCCIEWYTRRDADNMVRTCLPAPPRKPPACRPVSPSRRGLGEPCDRRLPTSFGGTKIDR